VNVIFDTEGFEITGETRDYVSTADSGNLMHRRFCPTCGAPMFSASEERPDRIIARAGTLDDSNLVQPGSTIWIASAPHWALIDERSPTHERQPPPLG
jgi:hypothetical protein